MKMSWFFYVGFTLLCISYTTYGRCPVGTFSKGNVCERCLPECRSGRVIVGRCNQTQRYICQCPNGKYWDSHLAFCKQCNKCGASEIVIQNCSHDLNRKCSKCPEGTYAKTRYHCEKCSHCEEGEFVVRKCGTNDTVCCILQSGHHPSVILTNKPAMTPTQPKHDPVNIETNNTIVVILSIVVAVFVVLLILVCACWPCSPKREQRNKYPDSSFTNDSEIEDFVHKRPIPPVRENGLLFRELNNNVVEELASLLNPISTRNWKSLAGRLGFDQRQIQNLDIDKQQACQSLLAQWSTESKSTVYVLYCHLREMKRDDCAELLQKYLVGDANQV